MRIITGKHKGRKILTVNDLSVRPATDRVKSAIFNALQTRIFWPDAKVLDLFAGSGNIGLEALSRGAKKITFVEFSKPVVEVLKNNILHLNEMENCNVFETSVEAFLKMNSEIFDIVFADPPYEFSELKLLPDMIFFCDIVKEDGLLVIEHPKNTEFKLPIFVKCIRSENYGRTAVSFFKKTKD